MKFSRSELLGVAPVRWVRTQKARRMASTCLLGSLLVPAAQAQAQASLVTLDRAAGREILDDIGATSASNKPRAIPSLPSA